MKLNKVTWYSKLLAAILFIALPFVGFYLGMKYQSAVSIGEIKENNMAATDQKSDKNDQKMVDSQKVSLKTNFKNGLLTYSGSVQAPSPCHELEKEVVIAESFPEQVQISLQLKEPKPETICAQVVTEKEFSGELKVSEQARISIYLNGKKVK